MSELHSGLSVSTDSRRNASATLLRELIEVNYFFLERTERQLVSTSFTKILMNWFHVLL